MAAEYTSVLPQTVAAGQNVLFTESPIPCNKGCVIHRAGSGIFNLRGSCSSPCAQYRVSFGANIAVPATGATATDPISLAIAVEGEPLASATMTETPGAVSQFNNVYKQTIVKVPNGYWQSVSIENNGVGPVDVANANLTIERIC